jgi:predicted alpha/beta superfamily hydrolase
MDERRSLVLAEAQAGIPGTLQRDLRSGTGGDPYRIFLYKPDGEAPAAGWPVLYLLDANAVIGIAVDALRVQSAYPDGTGISPAILVGIGYPTEAAYDSVRRSWDMGPPPGQSYPPHHPGGPDVRTGGADHFLHFIETEVKPMVAREAPVDARRQAIFGHSFGGLFVLYALFTRPAAFRSWIAASPAIWWEDAVVLRSFGHFEAQAHAMRSGVSALLLAGEFEQRLAPFQVRAPDAEQRTAAMANNRIIDNARDLAKRLAAIPSGRITACFEELPGETHMSVLPVAINRAVRFALGPER